MLNTRRRARAAGSESLLGPASLELERTAVRVGDQLVRTLAVVGYPREVARGWLEPLLRSAGELDLALHVEPVAPALAADRLRRQRARLESSRRLQRDRGALTDPTVAAAAEDADELAHRIARGESRLFRAGLYLTIRAADRDQLEQRTQLVRALCASLLLHTVPTSFRPLEGWLSTLPLGLDRLGMRRVFDTEALAAGFPFAAVDPPADEHGILYGLSQGGAPVLLDRFARENYNSVLLARSGAGKSYLAKLEALRLLYQGVQVFVLDPEDEYRRLTQAVGGAHLPLAGPDGAALNPLDLTGLGGPEPLSERIVFLAELCELVLGGLSGEELAVLDRAAHACYAAAGISADPLTHTRPAPLLSDLCVALAAESPLGQNIAERLSPYSTGSHSSLFTRPTTARPDGPFVCFSLRGLPERLKPAALLLALDAIWRQLEGPVRRRCVLVDEAWLLMREPAGARFLYRLAKSARKRWCGLTAVTQDAGDLLGTDLGVAVVSNAATQMLLRQAPQAIGRVAEAFHLSPGERRYLLTCPTGTGLLLTGDQRIQLKIVASSKEHDLVTSDPAQLAELAAMDAG